MHQACISGNATQVRRLLDQGHAVNIRDYAGWMPLHEAANHGHTEVVQLLLAKGAPINDKGGKMCDGVTALHDACGNGCLEVVEILLDAGANATLLTDLRETPFHSLEKWRAAQRTLDGTEQLFYETVRARLLEPIQRAGISLEPISAVTDPLEALNGRSNRRRSVRPAPHPSSDPVKSPKIRRSKSVNYTSDDCGGSGGGDSGSGSDASADETIRAVGASAIDSILDVEFPAPMSSADESSSNSCDRRQQQQEGRTNVNEYKTVMETLRKPGFTSPLKSMATTTASMVTTGTGTETSKRRMGLLDSEEVGENWLEIDVVSAKKRRVLSLNSVDSAVRQSPVKKQHYSHVNFAGGVGGGQTKENHRPSSSTISTSAVQIIRDNDDDESLDAFDLMMHHQPAMSSSAAMPPKRRSLSLNKTNKNGMQKNSLFNSGFVRMTSTTMRRNRNDSMSSTDSSENVVSSSNAVYDSMVSTVSAPVTLPPQHIPALTSVKVKVNEQLFNVPVNQEMVQDLTIGWLAEETARRYYKYVLFGDKYGIK